MAKAWKLEIFKDKQKKCRIRLRSGNGRIIMSSEAYSSHNKALETVEAFLKIIDLGLEYFYIKDLMEK
jgi:uncharacterized protein YegP (UPF0339 family)